MYSCRYFGIIVPQIEPKVNGTICGMI